MGKYEIGSAVTISILLGIIFLILFDGILALIIIGFVATYLTVPEKRNYKVGIFASCVMGLLIFIYGFIFVPQLPNQLSVSLIPDVFTLLLGLIIFGLICIVMGALGGYLAQRVFD
ncbi:MAG: hypothetical protein Kow0019_01190 [Methanobacteriaceae archaeon]